MTDDDKPLCNGISLGFWFGVILAAILFHVAK